MNYMRILKILFLILFLLGDFWFGGARIASAESIKCCKPPKFSDCYSVTLIDGEGSCMPGEEQVAMGSALALICYEEASKKILLNCQTGYNSDEAVSEAAASYESKPGVRCNNMDKSQCASFSASLTPSDSTASTASKSDGDSASLEAAFKKLGDTANDELNPADFTGPDALAQMFGRLVGFFAAGIGSFALALYIWAGFMWMTAAGNSEQVGKAINVITWTSLGAVVILSSYIMVKFIFQSIVPPEPSSDTPAAQQQEAP